MSGNDIYSDQSYGDASDQARGAAQPPSARYPKKSRRHKTPKSRATYESILEAAIDLFVEDGFYRSNTAKIADRAQVTRGCMQYYFPTTENVLMAATSYLNVKISEMYRESLDNVDQSRRFDPTQFDEAIDRIFEMGDNRYYLAWVELYNASRTDPTLKSLMTEVEFELDAKHASLMSRLPSWGGNQTAERFRTAHDLIRMVLVSWPTLIMANNPGPRTHALKETIKDTLYRLWQLERRPQTASGRPADGEGRRIQASMSDPIADPMPHQWLGGDE